MVCSCALETILPWVCLHKSAGLLGQAPRRRYFMGGSSQAARVAKAFRLRNGPFTQRKGRRVWRRGLYLAHIIHERFYCNRQYAAATSLAAGFPHPSGRARPSWPQRTVSSTPRPLRAPRARLAWRLGGFVTNRHDNVG